MTYLSSFSCPSTTQCDSSMARCRSSSSCRRYIIRLCFSFHELNKPSKENYLNREYLFKVQRWVKLHLPSLPWDFLTRFSSQAEALLRPPCWFSRLGLSQPRPQINEKTLGTRLGFSPQFDHRHPKSLNSLSTFWVWRLSIVYPAFIEPVSQSYIYKWFYKISLIQLKSFLFHNCHYTS